MFPGKRIKESKGSRKNANCSCFSFARSRAFFDQNEMEANGQTLKDGGAIAVGGREDGWKRAQHVLVMRHGDRIDQLEPLWALHADRPWDPPLTKGGLIRAWTTGKRLRSLGLPIHRVLVSPFRRCLQTAAQVIAALCAVVADDNLLLAMETSQQVVIDPSRVKVSVEYGLCEVLSRVAISPDFVPKDYIWIPNVSEFEAILPTGAIDRSVEPVFKEFPRWEESMSDARNRYQTVIQALADKFPHENLLLVTHGEGVGVALTSFQKGVEVFEVDYCAYSHMKRQVSIGQSGVISAENFEVLTKNGQSGICYYPLHD